MLLCRIIEDLIWVDDIYMNNPVQIRDNLNRRRYCVAFNGHYKSQIGCGIL